MASRTPLVMVVENEAAISMMLEGVMEDEGYAVAGPFATCASALKWLTSGTPDCAVLDTVLQDGSCKNLAAELSRLNIPFMVFSGNPPETNTIQEITEAIWIEKPALLQTVLDGLSDLLVEARLRQGSPLR